MTFVYRVATLRCEWGADVDANMQKSIQRLDIGVFPWHGSVELSILDDTCNAKDIAGLLIFSQN